MARFSSLVSLTTALSILAGSASGQVAPPARTESAGQMTVAATVSLAPTWFDPAETPGVITPFLTLYASTMRS